MKQRLLVYATTWCGDCVRSKRVLDALGIGYDWIDIDSNPEAAGIVARINRGMYSVPTIVFPDGSTLTEPTASELEEKLALAGMT